MQGVGRRREVSYINGGKRELLIFFFFFSCGKGDVRWSKLESKFTAEILETETTFTFDVNVSNFKQAFKIEITQLEL